MNLAGKVNEAWNSTKEAVKRSSPAKTAALLGTMAFGMTPFAQAQEKPTLPPLEILLNHPDQTTVRDTLRAGSDKKFDVYDGTTYELKPIFEGDWQEYLDKHNVVFDQIVRDIDGKETRDHANKIGLRSYVVQTKGEIDEGDLFRVKYDSRVIPLEIGQDALVQPVLEDRESKDQRASIKGYTISMREPPAPKDDETIEDMIGEDDYQHEPDRTREEEAPEFDIDGLLRISGGAYGLGNFRIVPIGIDPTGSFTGVSADVLANLESFYGNADFSTFFMDYDGSSQFDRSESDLNMVDFTIGLGGKLLGLGENSYIGVGAWYDSRSFTENDHASISTRANVLSRHSRLNPQVYAVLGEGKDNFLKLGVGGFGEITKDGGPTRYEYGPSANLEFNVQGKTLGLQGSAEYFKTLDGSGGEFGGRQLAVRDGQEMDFKGKLVFWPENSLSPFVGARHVQVEGNYDIVDGDEVVSDRGYWGATAPIFGLKIDL